MVAFSYFVSELCPFDCFYLILYIQNLVFPGILFDSSSGDIVRLLPPDDFLLDNPVCGYQKNGSKSLSPPFLSLPPHSLCLIALVGILSDFFLQMIFFLTTLSVDIRRMEVSLPPPSSHALPTLSV